MFFFSFWYLFCLEFPEFLNLWLNIIFGTFFGKLSSSSISSFQIIFKFSLSFDSSYTCVGPVDDVLPSVLECCDLLHHFFLIVLICIISIDLSISLIFSKLYSFYLCACHKNSSPLIAHILFLAFLFYFFL